MTPSTPNGAPDPDAWDRAWLALLAFGFVGSLVACVASSGWHP